MIPRPVMSPAKRAAWLAHWAAWHSYERKNAAAKADYYATPPACQTCGRFIPTDADDVLCGKCKEKK